MGDTETMAYRMRAVARRWIPLLRGWRPLGIALVILVPQFTRAIAQTSAPADAGRHTETLSDIQPAPPHAGADTAEQVDQFPLVRAALQQAEDLLTSGDPRAALTALDQAEPGDDGRFYEVHALRAQAALRLGDHELARRAAGRALALRPAAALGNVLLARVEQAVGRVESAIAHYRSATLAAAQEPDSPQVTLAWFRLGELLARRGSARAALEAYEHFDRAVWQTHPEHRLVEDVRPILEMWPRGAIEQRVELIRALGRGQDAVALLNWARETLPDDPLIPHLRARALLEAGQAADALALCEQQRAATSPNRPLPLTLEIQIRQAAGQLEPFVQRMMAQAAGPDVSAAVRAADCLTSLGDFAAAEKLWKAVRAARPDDLDLALGLTNCLFRANQVERGVAELAAFLRANPTVAAAPLPRIEAALSAPGPHEAANRPNQAGGKDAADDVALALSAAAFGQDDVANELLAHALQSPSGLPIAHILRGMIALRTCRWEDAKAAAAAARALAPHSALADYIEGMAIGALDDTDQALSLLKRAVTRASSDPGLLVALGKAHRRNAARVAPAQRGDERLAAQRHLSNALQIDPTYGAALEELIDAYLEDHKHEIARARFERSRLEDIAPDVLRRAGTAVRFAGAPAEELIAELENQRRIAPADAVTAMRLSRAYLQRGRIDDAEKLVATLHGDRQVEDEALLIRVFTAQRRLDFGAAAALVGQLVQRYPGRRDLQVALAQHLLHDFQWDAARKLMTDMVELKAAEDDTFSPERLLDLHIEFEEYQGGLELVEQWSNAGLADHRAQPLRLRLLLLAGQVDKAVALFDAAPDTRRLLADFLQACVQARRPDVAVDRIRRAREKSPDDEQLTYWLFLALREAREYDEAIKVLGDLPAETLDASNQRRYLSADCLRRAGRYDAALAEYEALASERFLGDVAREAVGEGLILTLAEAGQVERALAEVEKRSGDKGERLTQRLRWQRIIYDLNDRTTDYQRVTEQLHQLSPNDATLNNDLGYLWADRGERLDEATRMIRLAVAQEPLSAAYLDSLGWALYKAGDFEGARKWLSRATRLREGHDHVLWEHYGDALYRLGDVAGARNAWRRGLEALDAARNDGARDRRRNEEHRAALQARLSALESAQAPAVAPTATDER